MKIVALSYYFPPLAFPQSIQVGRLLQHSEHQVDVYCADGPGAKDASMQPQPESGMAVHRLSWSRRAKALWQIRRFTLRYRVSVPDVYKRWAKEAASHVLQNHGFDDETVLVTFGQPMSDHLAGMKIKRETQTPWIAHFSDPWVDNPFRRETRLVRSINRSLEGSVLRNADGVIFTSEETAELVMSNHPSVRREKVHVLPHSFDPHMYAADQPRRDRANVVLRYVGNFYGPRTPAPLFEALELLVQRDARTIDNVRIELIGATSRSGHGVPSRLPQELISLVSPVSYQRSLEVMQTADVLLVIDAPADASPFLPSKLIDYVGARRPIVGITPPGPAARVVQQLGGWVADPRDSSAVADALETSISFVQEHGASAWGRKEIRGRYAANVVTEEFDAIVRDVATPSPPR